MQQKRRAPPPTDHRAQTDRNHRNATRHQHGPASLAARPSQSPPGDLLQPGNRRNTDQKLFTLYLRYATTHERAFHKCLTDLLKLRSTKQKIEFGFESEKRRMDRHNNFLNLEEINLTYQQMKLLTAQSDLRRAEHPGI
jgi:hypothetical protein